MESLSHTERQFVGIGEQREATPDRQLRAREAFDAAYSFALKSNTHLWVVVVTHRGTDVMLDAFDSPAGDALPLLDVDTLTGPPMIGCYVCEQPYEPRLRRRKCPGEPRS